MANDEAAQPQRFVDVLRLPQNAVGTVSIAPDVAAGISMAAHRGPANEFVRGTTREVLVVAQRNIAASSVRFDLGWGWREHFFHDPRPVYVVPAEAAARWRLDGESQCVYLALDAGPLPGLLEELGVGDPAGCLWTLSARGFNEALVHELIERLWMEARSPHGCSSLLVDSYRVAIIHALARRAATLHAPRQATGGGLSRLQLRQVLAYIDAHLGEPLTVREIADVARVSVFHFSRLFRQATGRAPYAFVTDKRLERAAERLRQGEEPVMEIARTLGFASASHFGRAFAKRMGCSALRYRAQARR